jgi:hypothetical protein
MDTVQAISLLLGASWAAGINLYAAVLVLGLLNATGHVALPPDLQLLSDPLVLFGAGALYVVEFFADKTPGVDTGWDTLHTFIRIPAGALLALGMSSAFTVDDASRFTAHLIEGSALLGGGALAATSHATKAGTRVLINTSPEPFSNWIASITEDVAVVAGLWTALNNPDLFLGLLVLFLLLAAWLLPRIWQGIKRVVHAVGRWFGRGAGARVAERPTRRRDRLRRALYGDAEDRSPSPPYSGERAGDTGRAE